jgi:hypothetical protein
MKIMVRLAAVTAMVAASLHLATADDLAAALAARAGADMLAYVRVDNPKAFLDMMPIMAQKFFKNAMLLGVDMQRSWTFVVLNPQKFTNNLSIVVGVNDAGLWLDNFGKGGVSRILADPATATAPVRHFSESEETFDQQGYMASLRAGEQPDPATFKKKVTRDYFVTVRDGQGIIVGSAALLEQLTSAPALGGGTVRGDIVAGLHVPTGLALYPKEIENQKASLSKILEASAQGGVASGANAAAGKMVAAYLDALVDLLKQTDWIETGGELSNGTLKLQLGARPLAGTMFARLIAGQKPAPTDDELLSLLPADVAMLSTWRVTNTPEAVELFGRMLPAAARASGTNTPASEASLKDLMRETLAVYGGSAAVALKSLPVGQPGFNVLSAMRVNDPKRAREVQRRAAELSLNSMAAFAMTPQIGKINWQQNAGSHAGVEIDSYSIDLAGFGEGQAAVQNLYGSNVVSRVAYAGHYGLTAVGQNAAKNIEDLIDAAQHPPANPPARPRFDAAIASFPANNNGIFFLKLEDYFNMIMSAVPGMNSSEFQRMSPLLGEAKADIAGYLLFQPGSLMMQTDVPLDKFLEVSRKMRSAPPSGAAVPATNQQ